MTQPFTKTEAEMNLTLVEKHAPLQMPIEDPSASLPPTAQKIVAAARMLLVEKGYDAVTLEKVAAEAGVNKASIRYHFDNKAGLVSALVEFVLHEEFAQGISALSSTPHEDLVRALIDGKRHIIQTTGTFRGLFDVLPHAMRDEDLRRRIASTYPYWAEQNLRLLEVDGTGPAGRAEVLRGLGRLLSAVADGLAIQVGLDPDGFGLDEPLKALEFLLDHALPDLERLAAEADES